MRTHILKGTKNEIVEGLSRIEGEVREAIVFVEEPADAAPAAPQPGEDIFAEMDPYVVHVGDFDDSREAIYTRMVDE